MAEAASGPLEVGEDDMAGYDAHVVDRGSQPLNDALALIAPGHRTA
jgi:hypothetical protein